MRPTIQTPPLIRAALSYRISTDVLRLILVIVFTIAVTLLALRSCDFDASDPYGAPNPPGHAEPIDR